MKAILVATIEVAIVIAARFRFLDLGGKQLERARANRLLHDVVQQLPLNRKAGTTASHEQSVVDHRLDLAAHFLVIEPLAIVVAPPDLLRQRDHIGAIDAVIIDGAQLQKMLCFRAEPIVFINLFLLVPAAHPSHSLTLPAVWRF